jgi:hypothetical protein
MVQGKSSGHFRTPSRRFVFSKFVHFAFGWDAGETTLKATDRRDSSEPETVGPHEDSFNLHQFSFIQSSRPGMGRCCSRKLRCRSGG